MRSGVAQAATGQRSHCSDRWRSSADPTTRDARTTTPKTPRQRKTAQTGRHETKTARRATERPKPEKRPQNRERTQKQHHQRLTNPEKGRTFRERLTTGRDKEPTKPTNTDMARAPSYIPPQDAAFEAWFLNLSTLLTATPLAYGITAPQAATVQAQYDLWNPAYVLATDPTTRTPVTVAAKTGVRNVAEATIRPICQQIARNPSITDADKIALGLNPPNTTPAPVPPPTVAPVLGLISAAPLQVTLSVQNPDTPTSKAKPPGVVATEIWAAIGTTHATDPAQCTLVGRWTKSPNRLDFGAGDTGKKLTVFARYVTQSGSGGQSFNGPWSMPLNSTVL